MPGVEVITDGESYLLTGGTASFSVSVVAPPGGIYVAPPEYYIIGGDVVFTAPFQANVGSFVLTGNAAALNTTPTLTASGDSFTLTAADADFQYPPNLVAETGSFGLDSGSVFELTGGDVSFSLTLPAATGTFALSAAAVVNDPTPPARWFGPSGQDCVCDCCIKPHVDISITGSSVFWEVSRADTARILYRCNNDADAEITIGLTDGAASGTLTLGSGSCSYCIEATNDCGTETECVRNYIIPQPCDCLHENYEAPSLWGSIPPVAITLYGTLSAVPYPFCSGTADLCPGIDGTFVLDCANIARQFRITQPTGCSKWNTFVQVSFFLHLRTYPTSFIAGADVTVLYQSYWYRRTGVAATVNYYPTLTEIFPVNGANPFHTDDVFSATVYGTSWAGGVASDARVINSGTSVFKCDPENFLLAQGESGCRERTNGNQAACDYLTCIPSLSVSAEWL